MVKLQEVEDEHFTQDQPGPLGDENDDDFYTDTDSEITDDEEDGDTLEETLAERISALRDVIPPRQRAAISNTFNQTYSLVSKSLVFGGKALWIISTSVLLIGVPYALASTEEQQMMEMEKEMKMQQSANELLTPGATSAITQQLGGGQGHTPRPAL